MPMHRKNKGPRDSALDTETEWFKANKKRQRMRDKMAKASRKRNRK